MNALYPPLEPYRTQMLQVDDLHRLYVEECGREDGLPALFLHGGPGAGCEVMHRRFFDPERYRIVLFDQRGAGRSQPHAELQRNTTWDLVADIEQIRSRLGIERWLVFGGSWGSTLALAYAQSHQERVTGLVLRGVFLCRPHEIGWFYQSGASRVFPDFWEDFVAPIPPDERNDLLNAYHRLLTGGDRSRQQAAAQAWSVWEGRTATLRPNAELASHFADPRLALALARIECHYFVHDAFLEPNQLLRDASRLAGVPGIIVHGRYDLICPLQNAWELHRAWPDSSLTVVPDAGHAASEPGISVALREATDRFALRLEWG